MGASDFLDLIFKVSCYFNMRQDTQVNLLPDGYNSLHINLNQLYNQNGMVHLDE